MVFYAFGNTYQQIMKRIEYFESKLLQIRSSRLTQVGRTAEPILIQSAELNWFRCQTFHKPDLMY